MANQPIIKKRDKATSIAIFRDEYTNARAKLKTVLAYQFNAHIRTNPESGNKHL